jgi:DNA-binding GntR family transcriptional regulator
VSKSQEIYETIRERIVTGTYGPGYRVVIDPLAEEFGVSAGPIREALRRLEGAGLIEHTRNVGATVVGGRDEIFLETSEVMALLEGQATARSAPHLRPEDLHRLRELNTAMRGAADRGEMTRFAQLNRSFHSLIYERCPNRYLRTTIANCWDRVDIAYSGVFVRIPLRHERSIAEHDTLIGMLESGAPAEEIEAFTREHKMSVVRAYREVRALDARGAGDPAEALGL